MITSLLGATHLNPGSATCRRVGVMPKEASQIVDAVGKVL